MKFKLPPYIDPSHLWDVAGWDISISALESRGLTLSSNRDDLDSFQYTEIDDPNIGKILLVLRDHPPIYTGFDVMVQSDVFTADALNVLRERYGMDDKDLTWVTHYPHFSGPLGELLDPPMTEEDRERDYQASQEWFYRELEKQTAEKQRAAS